MKSAHPTKDGSEQPTLVQLKRLGDDELMASLQAGNHDALAVLFDRYNRLVFSIALKIVRDRGEAEDVLQDVFLDIFRAVAQFEADQRLFLLLTMPLRHFIWPRKQVIVMRCWQFLALTRSI